MGKWRRDRAKAQLEVAKEAEAKKDWRTVHKAAKRVVHEWPLSDYAPEAQQLLAKSYEERGDDERAFREYQNLLRYYPQNVNYEEIQQRQMAIADRFLGGQRFKLWGKIPLYRSWKKSAQMFQEVVNVGPQSEVAPLAQMKAGEAWEKKADGFQVSERERHKDFGRAVDLLHPVRYDIQRIGGSHAQRDLFAQLLIDAAVKAQRIPLARALLAERVALMPNNAPARAVYESVL